MGIETWNMEEWGAVKLIMHWSVLCMREYTPYALWRTGNPGPSPEMECMHPMGCSN